MTEQRLSSRRRRPSADPSSYAIRRLSSILVVGSAIVAAVSAGLLQSAGAPIPIAIAVGTGLFVAAATFATSVAAGGSKVWSDDARRASKARGASDLVGAWLRDLGQGSQLGPDPEQVVGRHTGART